MNEILRLICRMGIFMLCARTMIHFRPNKSYEKYLRFLAEMMVLIQIFVICGGRLGKNLSDEAAKKNWLSERIGVEEQNMNENAAIVPERILDEVQRIQNEIYGESSANESFNEYDEPKDAQSMGEVLEIEEVEIHVGNREDE